MRDDRADLQTLLIAVDASNRGLRRDACGDYTIHGNDGTIYADGAGYLLCATADRADTSHSFRSIGMIRTWWEQIDRPPPPLWCAAAKVGDLILKPP
jgi:hypothetical protein